MVTQPAVTCSKSTIQTARCEIFSLKYVQSVLVSLWFSLKILIPYSSVSSVNFEQVNSDWLMLNINIYWDAAEAQTSWNWIKKIDCLNSLNLNAHVKSFLIPDFCRDCVTFIISDKNSFLDSYLLWKVGWI